MGQPLSRVIVGFSHRQLGLGAVSGMCLPRWSFKCLFAAVIDRFQLEQDWKKEVAVKARITSRPWGGYTRFCQGGGLGVDFSLIP